MRARHLRTPLLFLLAATVPLAAVSSCGSGDDGSATNANTPGHDASDEQSGDASTDGQGNDVITPPDSSGACPTGQACGDGGVCAGGVCCEAALACGDACCDTGQLCSFLKCVTPGAECTESSDCADDEYCEYALGEPPAVTDAGPGDGGQAEGGDADGGTCVGGAHVLTGKCLPRPPVCPETDGGAAEGGAPDGPITCLETCEVHPPTTDLVPELKYSWGGEVTPPWASDIMMTPVVIELDDDDCDGQVTANDIPEIVFTTHYNGAYTSAGTLHAISLLQGAFVEKWSVAGIVQPSAQLAAGNIDGVPGNEIVACAVDGTVRAWHGDGSVAWTSPAVTCFQPSIANLDSDPAPEVIVEGGILDGATGQIEHPFSAPMVGTFLVSDLDGDHAPDIVSATQAYHADGTLFVDTGVAGHAYTASPYFKSGPAIADLDLDGKPEVIAVYFMLHQLAIWQYDAAEPGGFKMIRAGLDINGTMSPTLCPDGSAGSKWGGGPATVADFNGDGNPDVALAGGVGYAVFDGKKLMDSAVADVDTFLWLKQTHDCSSAGTGSSLFDFNGDGKAEVIYSDEYYLRVYEGETGEELFKTCNTTHTLNEYPVIADVDNDGQADIVVVSNAHNTNIQCEGTQQSGVRIFGSAAGSWVRTRRVWNQHAYHITNVAEDGTIPAQEPDNWTQPGLNNFRLNKQPGREFAAPDAVVSLRPQCAGAYGFVVEVRNLGEAALPAGVSVSVYAGPPATGTLLGQGKTTQSLQPAQAEFITVLTPTATADVKGGQTLVYATLDPDPSLRQCRTDNDTSPPVSGVCSGPR